MYVQKLRSIVLETLVKLGKGQVDDIKLAIEKLFAGLANGIERNRASSGPTNERVKRVYDIPVLPQTLVNKRSH